MQANAEMQQRKLTQAKACKRGQAQTNASKREQVWINANKRLHPPLLRFLTAPFVISLISDEALQLGG